MKASKPKSFTAAMVLSGIVAAPAYSMPAAKASADLADFSVAGAAATEVTGPDGFATVLRTAIKTPEKKDMIIGVSFETGLTTDTLVKSKGGTSDTSNAWGRIEMRVLVDGVEAKPGVVTYDMRDQTLMASLGGVLDCSDLNGDGIISFDECTLTEEQIQLILKTMAAHHFNFLFADLATGVHTVEAQAKVTYGGSAQAGAYAANAYLGKGALTVEEVRGVNGEGFGSL